MQASGAEKMTAACVYKMLRAEIIVKIRKQRNWKNSLQLLSFVKPENALRRNTLSVMSDLHFLWHSGAIESGLGSILAVTCPCPH